VLDVADGVARSLKPPVRIFIGTEPAQYRAERVFLWSVEQVRDPSRVYEIYRMIDLAGFERRRWLTGFTNYRFAIPHFAGGDGRAIYNDVDQIYLRDPAELFDMEMAAHGFLSITPRDTSVMLIDCARMAAIWPLNAVQHHRRKRIEAMTRAKGGLWGTLPREWNARDEEYVAGRSNVLHYTTIHTQPWQPFPERFVYQPNAVGRVWLEMEDAADRAHYQLFSAQHPSSRFDALRTQASQTTAVRITDGLEELLTDARASTVLDVQLSPSAPCVAERAGWSVTCCALIDAGVDAIPQREFDAIVCAGTLASVPDEDIPWLLDTLFRRARRCVYLSVDVESHPVADGMARRDGRDPSWWSTRIDRASAWHPTVHWKLVLSDPAQPRTPRQIIREGGRRADGRPPTVWVLKDHKAGHLTQSIGLADAVGLPYEIKDLRFNVLNHFSNRIRGASTLGLSVTRSVGLGPPWPDLVISTGRRTAPVARWIGEQNGGRTRLVQLGRRGGETVDAFDLVVACAHFRLPLHPRRLEIAAPLNAVTPDRLARAAARWRELFAGAPHPHVVLVVGGSSPRHRLEAATAGRMAEEVRALAESRGGSVFAITSPRTGAEATEAVRIGLGPTGRLHEWRPGEADNPYLGFLALADAVVVTGDSESMLAEAAATGKALFIYPLPERPLGFRWPAEWIARRAEARPRKAKGTVRPQQGLEYVCARLVGAGIVRPPRHLDQLHDALIRAGAARRFGAPFDWSPCRPLRDGDVVARRVRVLLGFDPSVKPDASESSAIAQSFARADLRRPWADVDGGDGNGALTALQE
jgi:mitochondrial fission protein ELM1